MVLLWQGAVSYFRIPAFLVPSPLVMLESLWTHLTPLLLALLFTLKITLISFLLSIVIGAAVAFILGAEPLCGNRPVSLHRVFCR